MCSPPLGRPGWHPADPENQAPLCPTRAGEWFVVCYDDNRLARRYR